MFYRVLNMILDIHRNADICQTDYNIPSILEFSPYSEVTHGSTTFKLTKV